MIISRESIQDRRCIILSQCENLVSLIEAETVRNSLKKNKMIDIM